MKTVILLRHADVDPPAGGPVPDGLALNAAGQTRAMELARVLGGVGISAVFVSSAQRTQQTAAPLAARLGLAAAVLPTDPEVGAGVIAGAGPVVLVVGHSNTVPDLIEALGAGFPGPPLTGHDDLFVLVRGEAGVATAVRLKYGAPPA